MKRLAHPLNFRTAILTAAMLSLASDSRGELMISEFLANNDSGLVDADGDTSDWIEIHNPDQTAASTNGYCLTDDPQDLDKWVMPDVTIPPNGYLVVFASAKDRAVAGEELHTNFALRENGDYLALVMPDATTIASEYAPQFPNQYSDVSYGFGTGGAITQETLVEIGAAATYFVPSAELQDDWRVPGFDDAAWTAAHTALGFGYGPPVGDDIPADGDLAGMKGVNSSVYIRIPFQIDDPAAVVNMSLKAKYEDGFVAHINDHQVESQNAPSPPAYNSRALSSEEVDPGEPFQFFPLDFAGHLVAGTNILAFQLMNNSPSSSDVILIPELLAEIQDLSAGVQAGFFDTPTPGSPNATLKSAPPANVTFSIVSGTFTDTFQLELSVATPGATIRYTTDGSLPTDNLASPSPIYGGPITISSTSQIRAKAFLPGALEGKLATQAYFKLSADAQGKTSKLPIVILDSFGGGAPFETSSTDRRYMMMAIFEPKGDVNPRASLANPPDLVTRAGVRKRGSSSGGWPKYSMSVEAWGDVDWEEKSIRPLGFGGEDDWILSARWQFDRALIRNPFIYTISRQIGRYAARHRFVELYNNNNGGDVGGTDYFGVYAFMERLDRDDDRIDVAGLDATIDTEPDISGGYIFKRDRGDPGEPSFTANGMGGSLVHVYPNGSANPHRPNDYFITQTQKTWLTNHLNQTNTALVAPNGINSSTGKHFSEYIDVDSFIDHVWLNTLAMNVDWGRLSAWYFKDRNGLINGGPIWDFDRNMGSEDGRDSNPRVWDGSGDSSRTWYDNRYPWYGRVLGFSQDGQNPSNTQSTRPDMLQKAIDRWYELRRAAFADANIVSVIDGMADEIREAQALNFQRWSQNPPNGGSFSGGVQGWEGEIAHMKGWLLARTEWIDDQFPQLPTFNQHGGVVQEGFQLTMNSLDGPTWYTLDGSDPRAPGGTPAASAIQFDGGPVDSVILPEDGPVQYVIPVDGSLGTAWRERTFDDSTWTSATSGVGFESGTVGTLDAGISTDIEGEMRYINASGYFRYEFEFDNAENINTLTLGMMYDDGFVAYLNGMEIARDRVPAALAWDSEATGGRSDSVVVGSFAEFDVTAHKSAVRNGTNVLAIQAMNTSAGSSDFLVRPRMTVNHTVTATPITLNESTLVTARTRQGNQWSAPGVAAFVVGSELASASSIVVSELMYHPAPPSAAEQDAGFLDQDLFEFVELMNISATDVDLSAVTFGAGLNFNFSGKDVTTLAPGERVLIVKNRAAFEERYGNGVSDRIAGEFEGDTNLANGGEPLTLLDLNGDTIKAFRYDDDSPWPEAADGDGPSLVLINPEANPDHAVAANWRLSAMIHGNPGAGDSIAFAGDPAADADSDGLTAFAEHALGTSDTDPGSGMSAISARSITVNGSNYAAISFMRNVAADDVLITPEISGDLANWKSDAANIVMESEVPNGDGTTTVTYRSTRATSADLRKYLRLRLGSR